MTSTDQELLGNFRGTESQEAFTTLVQRHMNLVYCSALRQVRSPQLAEDVAQSVFIDLARNAGKLRPDTILPAWLYSVTRRTAIDMIRSESRRQRREQTASVMTEASTSSADDNDWSRIEPLLEEAMDSLNDADRTAVLLRYFENKPLRDVGMTLGTTEEAARKRVQRAVDQLREFLSTRGISTTAAALTSAISVNAVSAAPSGLALTIASAAAAGSGLAVSSATSGAAASALAAKVPGMTTLQKAVYALVVIGAATTGLIENRRAARLADEQQLLLQQQQNLRTELEKTREEARGLGQRRDNQAASQQPGADRLRELLRLRAEVNQLRREKRESEQAAASRGTAPAFASQNPAIGAGQATSPASPFQVQLIADSAGENTQVLTNRVGADHAEALNVVTTPLLDHTAIQSVSVSVNPLSGFHEINLQMSEVGRELFAAITRDNINKRLAIVVNGEVRSAPVIRSEINGGMAQITGNFTEAEARQIAGQIHAVIQGK